MHVLVRTQGLMRRSPSLTAAQTKFVKGWGVGLAISQLTQFRSMLLVVLQSAAVLTVLESLWLVGNQAWLEEHIGARCREAAAAERMC